MLHLKVDRFGYYDIIVWGIQLILQMSVPIQVHISPCGDWCQCIDHIYHTSQYAPITHQTLT